MYKNPPAADTVEGALRLFNFLLQSIKNRSVEEFSKGYAQTIANHFDGKKLRVLTLPIQNIFYTGRRQSANGGEFVNADIMFTAQFQDSIFYCSNRIQMRVLPNLFNKHKRFSWTL